MGAFIDAEECKENKIECALPDNTLRGVAQDQAFLEDTRKAEHDPSTKRYSCKENEKAHCTLSTGDCICSPSNIEVVESPLGLLLDFSDVMDK